MVAKAAPKKTAPKKTAPVATVEDEEVDEVEETEAAPAIFGVSDIVDLIATKLKAKTSTRELRTLLRKMARDGRLEREIVAGNRARWEFSGPNDPQVKAIIAAFKSGELEQDKQEKLQALKERKAAQKAEAAAAAEVEDDEELEEVPAPKKTRAKAKAKPAPVEDDVEDDDEEL